MNDVLPGLRNMIGYRRDRLRSDLINLGVRSGTILLVQASMRAVAPAAGATREVFDALTDVLGPDGTLVVPTFTSLNSTTSRAHKAAVLGMSEAELGAYVAAMPVFDPATTPSESMGALAEYVRTRPNARRSSHPHTSFAAVGRHAAELMAVHDLDCHLGMRSPLGAMYQADADNLLLGLEYHQGCTMIHLAEYLAAPLRFAAGKHVPMQEYRARTVAATSSDKWVSFADLDLDDSDFKQIGGGYDALGSPRRGLRRGIVGASESRLVSSKHIVAFAQAWMVDKRE